MTIGRGGGCATRADSSSRRLPLKFPPVGRSRRRNHQEIWTKNVCSQNFCAKRFPSISRRGLRAWTCRRGKIQGADAGYSNPRASHPEALSLQLIRGVLGALVFEIFRPKSALKPDVFSKIMTPKIAKIFDNWRGGCATRADSSSRRLPLKFPPVGRSRRRNHQEIWTKNFCSQNFGHGTFHTQFGGHTAAWPHIPCIYEGIFFSKISGVNPSPPPSLPPHVPLGRKNMPAHDHRQGPLKDR